MLDIILILFFSIIWQRFNNSDQKAGFHRIVEFDGSSKLYKIVTDRCMDDKGGNTQTITYFDGKWQQYRLPCLHVMAVCRNRANNSELLVDSQFIKRRWSVQCLRRFNPLCIRILGSILIGSYRQIEINILHVGQNGYELEVFKMRWMRVGVGTVRVPAPNGKWLIRP